MAVTAWDTLRALADQGYSGLRQVAVNSSDVPALHEAIPDLVAQLAKLAEKYPNTAGALEQLGLFSGDAFPGYTRDTSPLGETAFSPTGPEWRMALNTDRLTYPEVGEILDELSFSGYNPPHTPGLEGTVAHEFGHGWWNRVNREAHPARAGSQALREAQDRFKQALYSLSDPLPSSWALQGAVPGSIVPPEPIRAALAKQISDYAGSGWASTRGGPLFRLHEPVAELFRAQEYPFEIAQRTNLHRPAWQAFSQFQDEAKDAGFRGSANIGLVNDIGLGLAAAAAASPLAKLVTQDKQDQGLIRGGLQGAAAGFGLTRSPLAALIGGGLGAASTLLPVDSLGRAVARSVGVS